MVKILMVTSDKGHLLSLAKAFETDGPISLAWVPSGTKALDHISETPVDLVVADETLEDMTGIELAIKMVRMNPLINCSLISGLSIEDFHESTEGLGIIMQLPLEPGTQEANDLMVRLNEIKGLSA